MSTSKKARHRKVTVDSELATKVAEILPYLSGTPDTTTAHTSHGPLTLEILIQMLLEDVEMSFSRPGSWEGAGMAAILASHGYRY